MVSPYLLINKTCPSSLTHLKGGNNNNNTPGTTGPSKDVRASEHDIFHKPLLPSVEPCLMKTSGAWGLSLGLLSEKVWPSFQTNKQSGQSGIHLLDTTPLAITPLATVRSLPLSSTTICAHLFSVQGKATSLGQTIIQKATNL